MHFLRKLRQVATNGFRQREDRKILQLYIFLHQQFSVQTILGGCHLSDVALGDDVSIQIPKLELILSNFRILRDR